MRTPAHSVICLFLSNLSLIYEGVIGQPQIDELSLWPPGYDRRIKAKNLSIGIVMYRIVEAS